MVSTCARPGRPNCSTCPRPGRQQFSVRVGPGPKAGARHVAKHGGPIKSRVCHRMCYFHRAPEFNMSKNTAAQSHLLGRPSSATFGWKAYIGRSIGFSVLVLGKYVSSSRNDIGSKKDGLRLPVDYGWLPFTLRNSCAMWARSPSGSSR